MKLKFIGIITTRVEYYPFGIIFAKTPAEQGFVAKLAILGERRAIICQFDLTDLEGKDGENGEGEKRR